MSFFEQGGFPANYFGKGEGWELPDDPKIVEEFTKRFLEWEAAHPEDPTGDLALAAFNIRHPAPTEKVKGKRDVEGQLIVGPTLTIIQGPVDEPNECNLRLQLPASKLQTLKNYAHYKRRRPRDIIIDWINKNCKL